jgi:hypothetical protein
MTPHIAPYPLTDEAAANSFRDFVRQKAIAHKSSISYRDNEGRLIEEWPATGEMYEIELTETAETIRLRRLA